MMDRTIKLKGRDAMLCRCCTATTFELNSYCFYVNMIRCGCVKSIPCSCYYFNHLIYVYLLKSINIRRFATCLLLKSQFTFVNRIPDSFLCIIIFSVDKIYFSLNLYKFIQVHEYSRLLLY